MMSIKNHKKNVMNGIIPVMKKSHKLSTRLKKGLLYGNLSKEELFELSSNIAQLKEQALNMKITCISFVKETLSKEQFKVLIKLDKNMPYLNYPYNY